MEVKIKQTYLLPLKLLFILLLTVVQAGEGVDFVLVLARDFGVGRGGFFVL
jgi:hypothetical protein